jgi:thiamine transport system permease protein
MIKNSGRVMFSIRFIILFISILPFVSFGLYAIYELPEGGKIQHIILNLLSKETFSALKFSLFQAFMSTLLAVCIGFPGAFFVATFDFPGRKLFFSLAAVPFCLPPILVVLGFILYYGKNGLLFELLGTFGIRRTSYSGILYSLPGLIGVHAFYNFPLVIQNVGSIWSRLPQNRAAVARTLGAGKLRAFLIGTLPYLVPSILQSASLIFLFCFFSFTIVLVFGGLAGSTLEVGIYRALRFTHDKPQAFSLAIIQTFIALAIVGIFGFFTHRSSVIARGFGEAPKRKRIQGFAILLVSLYALGVIVFFLGPLVALTIEAFRVQSSLAGQSRFGFDNFARLLTGTKRPLLSATQQSLTIGFSATVLATIIGALIAHSTSAHELGTRGIDTRRKNRIHALILSMPLAFSPAIIAAGWSTILRNAGGTMLIIVAEVALIWPFVSRNLEPAFSSLDKKKHEAARTLGSSPLHAIFFVDIPSIMPSVASSMAFAFSMILGDVNIPLILGGGSIETLPLLLYRLASSYRFNEACAVGIVLALLTSIAFFMQGKTNEIS